MKLKISIEIDGEDMGYCNILTDLKQLEGYTLDYANDIMCRTTGDRLAIEMYGTIRISLEKRGIK